MDKIDLMILSELGRNGRQSAQALGDMIGRSPTSVARRQKVLEDDGIILRYEAILDLTQLGYRTIARVKVKLKSQGQDVMEAFEAAVSMSPSITSCDLMSGSDDYLMTVVVTSLDCFADVHRDELTRLPGVAQMESSFVLRQILPHRLPPLQG